MALEGGVGRRAIQEYTGLNSAASLKERWKTKGNGDHHGVLGDAPVTGLVTGQVK